MLIEEEENALLEYIKYRCSLGFPMTKRICKAYAWSVAKRSRRDEFSKKGPSEKWWGGFKKRNPGLSLRKADSLDCG